MIKISQLTILKKFAIVAMISMTGCAIFATRPVQEMSYTTAAIRAAREVQADTVSPDHYLKAIEFFDQAKREYRYKNFKKAYDLAHLARLHAERAEFDALKGGSIRAANSVFDDPLTSNIPKPPPVIEASPSPTPYPYPTKPESEPMSMDAYEDFQKKQAAATPAPQTTSAGGGLTMPTLGK
jgi:hypothetical protein